MSYDSTLATAETKLTEAHAIARELARALCLGQRGFGFQGDRLPDIAEARGRCARLLELFGEKPPFRYDR